MTGHDLDLREWFVVGCWIGAPIPQGDGEPIMQARTEAAAAEIVRDHNGLVAEVESLRAKLTAAEQERDDWRNIAEMAERGHERAEAALAAVREAVEPLAGFAVDEFARKYARRDKDAAVVVQALYDLHQVLTAAEQPEPEQSHVSQRYESCVTDSSGRCTRWSHDHGVQ